jgi:hypothetical protein
VIRRMRRLRVLAPTLALVAVLAGCTAIPTGGGVQTAALDSDPDESLPIARPPGPEDGQTPAELLQGFINAGRAPQNVYQVAQQYLTADADWSGTDRVLIISPSRIEPFAVDEDTLGITVSVVGEVDAIGRYAATSSQQTLTYDFVMVDGQPRIARADPGTVLSITGFEDAFREYPLYYFDASFNFLVPDLRWFPRTRTVANRIAVELMKDPAPWLGVGVLFSAFPQGTDATADVDSPDVTVDLSAEARAESAQTQRRMIQQLEASLGGLGTVTVTADGLSLAPSPEGVPPDSTYAVRPVIGGWEGQFGTLGTDGITPLPTIETRADALEPTAASLGRLRNEVAVLGPAGVTLVTGSDSIPIDGRSGLLAPSLDPHGFVWTAPAGDPGAVLATAANGEVHALAVPAEGTLVAMDVARDGTRLLVALSSPTGPRVFVIGIQRNADLAPVAFGSAFELPHSGTVLDATWVDGVRVAVLTAEPAGTRVDVLPLGGPAEDFGEVDSGVAIVGGDRAEGLRVLRSDGAVLRPSGAGNWVQVAGLSASFLGTQQ